MTDITEPADTGMQPASLHASTSLGPPTLTPPPTDPPTAQQPPQSSAVSSTSPSSRPPVPLDLSPSDVSSSGNGPPVQEDLSPPTSAASSQNEPQDTGSPQSQPGNKEIHVKGPGGEAVADPRSTSTSLSPTLNGTSGTKRTASGEVKRSSVNGLGDIISHSREIHLPHTLRRGFDAATTAPVGNILEVSQQLRTKLKYAMVKVQNGWQSRSLDEVESLASHSPRSTMSGLHRLNDHHVLSPRAALARTYQRESSESDSSDGSWSLESRGLVNMTHSPRIPSQRALAPPADIMPGSRRRPTPNGAHAGLNHGSHAQSRPTHSSSRPQNSQRTPSQNAAMEADAVETLLFMASPNNSGYNPTQASLSQPSPRRTQFGRVPVSSPKRVIFAAVDPTLDKAAIIDRMLDDLSDGSDAELEQAFRLADKGRLTAAAAEPVPT